MWSWNLNFTETLETKTIQTSIFSVHFMWDGCRSSVLKHLLHSTLLRNYYSCTFQCDQLWPWTIIQPSCSWFYSCQSWLGLNNKSYSSFLWHSDHIRTLFRLVLFYWFRVDAIRFTNPIWVKFSIRKTSRVLFTDGKIHL